MTRRELIAGGLAALLLPFFGLARVAAGCRDPLLGAVCGLFSDLKAARSAGRRCLAVLGAGEPLERLAALAGFDAVDLEAGWTTAEIRRQLIGQRRRDLEAGRVVVVDGWVLARCEAALLALTASS